MGASVSFRTPLPGGLGCTVSQPVVRVCVCVLFVYVCCLCVCVCDIGQSTVFFALSPAGRSCVVKVLRAKQAQHEYALGSQLHALEPSMFLLPQHPQAVCDGDDRHVLEMQRVNGKCLEDLTPTFETFVAVTKQLLHVRRGFGGWGFWILGWDGAFRAGMQPDIECGWCRR